MKSYIQKNTYLVILLSAFLLFLSACSTNPATGKSQFAALMSPEDEIKVGAQEHEKIVAQFGLYKDPKLQNYVDQVGARISEDTERPDIAYKFFILDSPIVNAFALPGGYVYVSRGLLALANSEAELAAVLAHEVGHITGRHSAERYSHSVLTNVGGSILSILINNNLASQALGLGGDLYLSSYSRGQENEADTLGIRYMTRGGYDPDAMSDFLNSLNKNSELEGLVNGKKTQHSYFSTHPPTKARVEKTKEEAQVVNVSGMRNKDRYFTAIDGMTFGDSAAQGFARGQTFIHPQIGFLFETPKDYTFQNKPSQIVMTSADKETLILFDMSRTSAKHDPQTYLAHIWMKDQDVGEVQTTTINNMPASYAMFKGRVNSRSVDIYIYAIQFTAQNYARFQIAVPRDYSGNDLEAIKKTAQSFRPLKDSEKRALLPDQIDIIQANAGDTIEAMSAKQSFKAYSDEYFRVINGLDVGENIKAGEQYKIVVSP